MSSSRQFTKFYSSACSTGSAVTDFLYGHAFTYDHCRRYTDYASSRKTGASLHSIMNYMGWDWGYFGSSPFQPTYHSRNDSYQEANNRNIPQLADLLLKEFKAHKENGVPFAAYFWDDTSHLAFSCDPKNSAASIQERMRVGYQLLDASVNYILSGLAELGLWENTVIVGFGDHGDEPWSHGLNKGYCHAVAPYSSICWTPFFIFDNGEHQGISEQLVSLVDLRYTIARFMQRGADDLPPEKLERLDRYLQPRGGNDIFNSTRRYALSQNMFALQLEHTDPEEGMEKAYGITNGEYRLVAASGGPARKGGGLELFCERTDPTNSRNLLDFFELDGKGEITGFRPPEDAIGMHFRQAFRPPQVKSIVAAFGALKRFLVGWVRRKEERALKMLGMNAGRGSYHLFPERAFQRAKRRR
jgi:hypothetical protein